MRIRTTAWLIGIAALATLGLSFVPAAAQKAGTSILAQLDRGAWEVRYRDGQGVRKICLRDGTEFLQLRHPGPACNRFVVEDGPKVTTVQYTCRGNGYGRTSVRRETAALVQIESQGIAGGKPFQFSAEARRTGSCR